MNQTLGAKFMDLSGFTAVRSPSLQFWAVLLGLMVFGTSTLAQDSSGILSGRVLDVQGAGIPGAIVKVKNTETGLQRQASCDATGYYRVRGTASRKLRSPR